MKVSRCLVAKPLALILSLALAAPGMAGSMSMTGRLRTAPAAGNLGLPVGVARPLNLAPLNPNLTLTHIPAAGVASAIPVSPVTGLINTMKASGVALPETLATPTDAAKLKAAAAALPEGSARDNLLALAEVIDSAQGGHAAANADLAKAYDYAAQSGGAAQAVPAQTGIWSQLARLPLLRNMRGIRERAEKGRPQAAAADPGVYEVAPQDLRWVPAPEQLPASTKELAVGEQRIVGQDAALKALRFGLKMPGQGYNLYVSGPEGSGRATAVRAVLSDIAPALPTPPDLVAATNFQDQQKPVILQLPAGQGAKFARAVADFVSGMARELPQALEAGQSDEALKAQYQAVVEQRQKDFDAEIAQVRIGRFGILIRAQKDKSGSLQIVMMTTLDGQPFKPEDKIKSGEISEEELAAAMEQLQARAGEYAAKFQAMLQQNQADYMELAAKLSRAEGRIAAELVARMSGPILESVQDNEAGSRYAAELLQNAVAKYDDFLPQKQDPKGPRRLSRRDPADNYRVSVLADNGAVKGAPVVWEENPTYENLFGLADPNMVSVVVPDAGMLRTSGDGGPTLIGGSFLKASGGFLVLNAADVLQEPGAWKALMHAVRSGQAEITEGGLEGLATLKGAKYYVPGQVKVVLLGSPMVKMLLEKHDEDFVGNFNASAEFESDLDINADTVASYVEFMKHAVLGSAGQILDMTRGAISSALEYCARLVDSHQKISSQFGALFGLLREATFWAREAGRPEMTADDIKATLAARQEREEGYRKHIMANYLNDIFHVGTSGSEVGQINGLAVMGSFGVPARITVTASAGAPGMVSVDRDAGSAGRSFVKALGVVEGFLRHNFAQKKPISAHIRISFEQNYGGIDGDSATSTEIYAILSRLAGVPIRQNFAVTGSADQFGNVQAIGGVNHKIEGFFALCKARGLTGDQGVIIPTANVADLQLDPEVVQAVKDGKFHVYAVSHVGQGLEILTGAAYQEILRKADSRLAGLRGER